MTTTHAVILSRPTTQPAGTLATFVSVPGVLDVTASGRVTETSFTAAAANYDDEPVVVYENPAGAAPKLMLPQELQSTGDDQFTCLAQPGLQAAPGMDSHRVESAELLLRRGAAVHPGTATMTIAAVTSHVLDTQGGTIGTAVQVPGLNNASVPIKGVTGLSALGRFISFQLKGTNANSVFQYLGAILRGRRTT